MSDKKLYPYNPDYADKPEVLHGVIKDQGEAIGTLQARIKELEADIDRLTQELNAKAWDDRTQELEADNLRLREALEFADGHLYSLVHTPGAVKRCRSHLEKAVHRIKVALTPSSDKPSF